MGVMFAGLLAVSDALGGTTKEVFAFSPLSRIIFETVDGRVSSSGILVNSFLALTLDVTEDDTAGLVEVLLLLVPRLQVTGAMVRMLGIRRLVDLVRVGKLEVLGKLEMVGKSET